MSEKNTNLVPEDGHKNLAEKTDQLLAEAEKSGLELKEYHVPVAGLSSLGAGVSSLIPALRTVTTTTSFNMEGLYRVANGGIGDALKMAKDGTYWGAMKTVEGTSKMAKFAEVGSLQATSQAVAAFNPATLMMAAALYSIDRKLDRIEESQKKILKSFENEKKASIEGNVEQLMSIVRKYKNNWDNDIFIQSNHKMVSDIQRDERQNMRSLQKGLNDALHEKQYIVNQPMVQTKMKALEDKCRYYRLSLYTFALASLLEVLLSGNFSEANIEEVKQEIHDLSVEYKDTFTQCSNYLEKMTSSSIETNVLKGLGDAGKAAGKFIGSIPVIEKGPVDEFLHDNGSKLKKNADSIESDTLRKFSGISDPETEDIVDQMETISRIYNNTREIRVDGEQITLLEACG